MGHFLRALFLAVVWAALQGSFSVINLLVGFGLGLVVLWLMQPLYALSDPRDRVGEGGDWRIVLRVWWFVVLVLVFLWELLRAGIRVAYEVVRPTLRIQPGVFAYPLDVQTGREITVLANLISLTPGTLSLDVSDDRRILYIHALSVESEEAMEVRRQVKRTLEKHVARALGPFDGNG